MNNEVKKCACCGKELKSNHVWKSALVVYEDLDFCSESCVNEMNQEYLDKERNNRIYTYWKDIRGAMSEFFTLTESPEEFEDTIEWLNEEKDTLRRKIAYLSKQIDRITHRDER